MTKEITNPNSEESLAQTLERGETQAFNQAMAKSVLSPEFSASIVVTAYSKSSCIDQIALLEQLQVQNGNLATGNLAHAEGMLMCQATALQTIFTSLAARASSCSSTEQIQSMLGLALRAQSGSRATLQTLGELKNPRHATFVRQSNIAHGHQQVNNGTELTRTLEETAVSTNKLSGKNHELLEDPRAPNQAITGHPGVAAVEKVHRTKVR